MFMFRLLVGYVHYMRDVDQSHEDTLQKKNSTQPFDLLQIDYILKCKKEIS